VELSKYRALYKTRSFGRLQKMATNSETSEISDDKNSTILRLLFSKLKNDHFTRFSGICSHMVRIKQDRKTMISEICEYR